MLPDIRDYSELYRRFRWQVPAAYNIGVGVCDRWAAADPRRTAIVHVRPDLGVESWIAVPEPPAHLVPLPPGNPNIDT